VGQSIGWLVVVLAFSIPLYRSWVSLATILIMLLWLFGGGVRQRLALIRRNHLIIAVLLFLGINLLSVIWSAYPDEGIRYLSKYRYLLLIPVIATSVGPSFRRRAETAFMVASAVSVFLSYGILFGLFNLRGAYPGNPAPTMSHIDYSMVLAFASLLILNRALCQEMEVRWRLTWAACFLFVASGLLINIGRSGQMAFAVGLLALTLNWAHGKSPRTAIVAVAAVVLAGVLVWASVPRVRTRVGQAQNELRAAVVDHQYDSNLGGRVAAMMVANEIFRQNPILGTGVGANMPLFRDLLDTSYRQLKPAIYWYTHLHNQYAQVATEVGLVGFLALAWVFWEVARGPYSKSETDGAALILTCTFLVGFLGDPFFRKQLPLVMFAMAAGLICAHQLEGSSSSSTS
jgi:O-antigen ligase